MLRHSRISYIKNALLAVRSFSYDTSTIPICVTKKNWISAGDRYGIGLKPGKFNMITNTRQNIEQKNTKKITTDESHDSYFPLFCVVVLCVLCMDMLFSNTTPNQL
jgi:hypothetical protein